MKNKTGFKRYFNKHRDAFTAATILTPMLLWWIIACGFPLVFGFFLGFFQMRGVIVPPKFIGFDNFVTFFTDSTYMTELWNSIWIGVVGTILTNVVGLLLAVMFNTVSKLKGFYRSIWYMPAVTSTVAISQVICILFDPVNGAINAIRIANGMQSVTIDTDYNLAIFMIFLFGIWKGAGGSAIVWLAGLLSVDRCQYEAAEVDGANKWESFIHITLPGIKPIATYIIITGMIGALQIYEPVAFITNGGPLGKTNVLVLRIIQDGYFDMDLGMAGASSLVLAAIVIVATLTYYKFSRENIERDERRAYKRIFGGKK